jgi:hypothetical protein
MPRSSALKATPAHSRPDPELNRRESVRRLLRSKGGLAEWEKVELLRLEFNGEGFLEWWR